MPSPRSSTPTRPTPANRTAPRREPTQARATATRDAIVEAAARVLERDGLSAFNTNRVAEAASISIGSLYQYYPHKAALLIALGERETAALVDRLDDAFGGLDAVPLARGVRALVDAALDQRYARPQLAAALDYAERELPPSPTLQLHRQSLLACLVKLLSPHRKEVRGDLLAAATDIQTIVHSLIDAALLRDEPRTPALRQRVERAALGYLGWRPARGA